MTFREQPLVFDCEGASLLGIVSLPAAPYARGVLIVVGGPQYRAGSSRQFTLLARHLAQRGVAAMRFDYRGMGDSGGASRSFERVDADLRCAIETFVEAVPALKEIVIWGLCDAASAALLYAYQDRRVKALVLLNPWVHTEQGEARAYLRHYYVERLLQASFWRKVAAGEFKVRAALESLARIAASAFRGGASAPDGSQGAGTALEPAAAAALPERMEAGLRRFEGAVLLVLSGNDLVAQEFRSLVDGSPRWRKLLATGRVSRRDLPEANHTFARREWRDQVARWTEEWVRSY